VEPGLPPLPWSTSLLFLPVCMALAACGDDGGGAGGTSSAQAGAGGGDGGAPPVAGPIAVSSSSTAVASSSGTTSTTTTGGGVDVTCSGATPTLSGDVQPILTASCAVSSCHKGSSPDKDLDLAEGAAWGELVGVDAVECTGDRLRVEPGAPEESYLVAKVLGVDLCSGRRMPPPTRAPLDAAEIQTLVDWICNGALDD
jgi:hypothetical protein